MTQFWKKNYLKIISGLSKVFYFSKDFRSWSIFHPAFPENVDNFQGHFF